MLLSWMQGEPQRCMHQDEALRPFTAVLRGAACAESREAAVAAVAEAVTVHARGLGSGARVQRSRAGCALISLLPDACGCAVCTVADCMSLSIPRYAYTGTRYAYTGQRPCEGQGQGFNQSRSWS